MLSMGMKQGEKVELYFPIKEFLENTIGSEATSQIDTPLKNFQQTREELLKIGFCRNDSSALEHLIVSGNMYISMHSTISNNMSFGLNKVITQIILGKPKDRVHLV